MITADTHNQKFNSGTFQNNFLFAAVLFCGLQLAKYTTTNITTAYFKIKQIPTKNYSFLI